MFDISRFASPDRAGARFTIPGKRPVFLLCR